MAIKFEIDHYSYQYGCKIILTTDDELVKKVVDTYYFALDNNFMPEDESHKKTMLAIVFYLKRLISEVANLAHEKKLLFPIDFSDEYVGFLIIDKDNNDNLNMNYGLTTKIHGYSYAPTNFEFFNQNIEIEYRTNWGYKTPIEAFIDGINKSIIEIEAMKDLEFD